MAKALPGQLDLTEKTVSEANERRRRSDASAYVCDPKSRTEQSHRESCDINFIMARYEKTGEIPRGRDGQPFFGDFSKIASFHDAQLALADAHLAFGALPAKLRARFENDPGKLLDFMSKAENLPEAIKLGLVDAPKNVADPVVEKAREAQVDPTRPPLDPKGKPTGSSGL